MKSHLHGNGKCTYCPELDFLHEIHNLSSNHVIFISCSYLQVTFEWKMVLSLPISIVHDNKTFLIFGVRWLADGHLAPSFNKFKQDCSTNFELFSYLIIKTDTSQLIDQIGLFLYREKCKNELLIKKGCSFLFRPEVQSVLWCIEFEHISTAAITVRSYKVLRNVLPLTKFYLLFQ